MSKDDCTTKIKEKNILLQGHCKPTNTFIKANEDDIKKVCEKVKTYNGNNFDVIECSTSNINIPCLYQGKLLEKHQMTLTCEGNLPVHYGEPRTQG